MNLTNLQTFNAIVETGNLNRAATRLNVTQSTINARLNNLEQEVGQALFHRRKSGAELTAAGFRFQRYAQLIPSVWRQACQETALPASISSVCHFGCHADLWNCAGDTVFASLRAAEKAMAVSAWPGEQPAIDRWMSNGLIDMALCHTPSLNDSWRAYQLGSEKLIQVASIDREVTRWDASYIYVDLGEAFRKDHAAVYADGDTPTVTFGSADWALGYLLQEGGSAYLPERLISNQLATRRLFRVRGAVEFSRPVYLLVDRVREREWQWFDDVMKALSAELNPAGR